MQRTCAPARAQRVFRTLSCLHAAHAAGKGNTLPAAQQQPCVSSTHITMNRPAYAAMDKMSEVHHEALTALAHVVLDVPNSLLDLPLRSIYTS